MKKRKQAGPGDDGRKSGSGIRDLVPVTAEGHSNGRKFTPEQQEEIKYLIRRAIYADFSITPALVARGLQNQGYDVSRELAAYYIGQVQKEDAESERIRQEIPDLTAIRSAHRKHREAVFNAAMTGRKQLAQANRALDALAALDGVAVSKSTISVEGKDGGPVQVEDVTQMSDATLRTALAAAKAKRKAEQTEEDAERSGD